MSHHIDLVGMLFMLYGIFELLIVALVGLLFALASLGIGGLGLSSGDMEAVIIGFVYGGIGIFAVGIALITALGNILAGMWIRQRRKLGRTVGFIMAALACTSFPIGTALGVFAIMVLIDKEAAAEFVE